MAKKIVCDYLSQLNFKGTKDRRVDFDPEKTVISGRNKSGKSTIADALFWLLSGKDRFMRTDTGRGSFQVKTVDADGEVIPHLDHSVEGGFTVTDTETGEVIQYKLRRTLVEEWSKAKGDTEPTLKGNTTHYYVDDVECKAGEYNDLVRSLIPEQLMGIISNPEMFFKLDWQRQREILVDMAGNVSLREAAAGDGELEALADKLENQLHGRGVDDYRAHLASQRKMVKKDLDSIQPTINGIESATPEMPDVDYLKEVRAQSEEAIKAIDEEIAGQRSANEALYKEVQTARQQVTLAQAKVDTIRTNAKAEAQRVGGEWDARLAAIDADEKRARAEHTAQTQNAAYYREKAEQQRKRLADLRTEWKAEQGRPAPKTEPTGVFVCPLYKKQGMTLECQHPALVEDERETIAAAVEHFNQQRAEAMRRIEEEASRTESNIQKMEQQAQEAERAAAEAKKALDAIPSRRATLGPRPTAAEPAELAPALEALKEAEGVLAKAKESQPSQNATAELTQGRADMVHNLEVVAAELAKVDQIKANRAKVAELDKRGRELGQQLDGIDREDDAAARLLKAQMNMVEERVNGRFHGVQFRLFERQINGTEVPTCTATIGGVKPSSANDAGVINAGVEVIKAISEHYGVYAPVFVDRAESVDDVVGTENQQILLVVRRGQELKVEAAR